MKVSALIPIKGFHNAKQRLSPLLDRAERECFAEIMFRHVVRQVVQARGLTEAYVVTRDERVGAIAGSLGAKVIHEQAETGETDAVDFARAELMGMGYEAVLIVPGDMPLIRSEDIEQVLSQVSARAAAPFALLVPSHDRMGTNALLLAPPDIINLRFGYDSFTYHMSQVSAQGLPLRFFENERIALDIDEPRDLERFLAFGDEAGEGFRAARKILQAREAGNKRRSGGR
ncbi:MAG: 2-phospho-L-lactate guanylyltransferase [Candidatus Binatia bacterium]